MKETMLDKDYFANNPEGVRRFSGSEGGARWEAYRLGATGVQEAPDAERISVPVDIVGDVASGGITLSYSGLATPSPAPRSSSDPNVRS